MATSKCLRCGTVSETCVPSGMCETCRSDSDATVYAGAAPFQHVESSSRELNPLNTQAQAMGPSVHLPPGGYLYEQEVGGGGMGVVWRAVRVSTQQTVAVKKLLPDCYTPSGLRRFVAEARALAVVDHPNVVRLYDFVPDPADPLLVMEFVPGQPLSSMLKKSGPLPPDRAAEVIAAAARGVQAAHDAGVIHRDLKPPNLLITPDGRVKVADFGLGKRVDAADGVTRPGLSPGGTPGFMAPEQVDESLGEPGKPADVWGLGACLFAALTARSPFPTGTSHVHRVLSDPVAPPRAKNRAIPRVLDAIVLKCLEKNPARRYPSAAALADDLDRFLRGESTVAQPLPPVVSVWRRARSTPRGVVAAWAVALAVVAVGITLAMVPKRSEEKPEQKHARLQRLFTDGKPVPLVPDAGPPEWSEWVYGRAEISDSPGRDRSAYLVPSGANALKLFDPPGDSYRVSFDLQHRSALNVKDPISKVGVILFHERFADDRVCVDRFFTVSFADYDVHQLQVGPGTPAGPATIDVVEWLVFHYGSSRPDEVSTHSLRTGVHKFAVDPHLPGKWRRVVAEVSPAGWRLLWAPDAEDANAEPMPIATYSAAKMQDFIGKRRLFEKHDVPDSFSYTWKPSGGLGVWAVSSGLAFRSVTVSPTQ